MSKSFEQIFSESNSRGFTGYDGPCKCCEPKPTDKVTKAYNRGVTEERERIIKLLEDEELHTHPDNLMKNYDELVWLGIKEQLIALIKGEDK